MTLDATTSNLCKVCSKLNIQCLTHPILPCRNSLPCSTPPNDKQVGVHVMLGSMDEIKSRRSTCNVCRLIAECLDEEPPDLDGVCRLKQNAQFCNFKLPGHIKARDPTITHFHLTQVTVVFDPTAAESFHGPSFPWDMRERENRASHYIMKLQVRARSSPQTGNQATALPQTERELLETIGVRYVGTQVNAQLIRRWLHDCECKHGELCQRFSRLSVERDKAPAFVVDALQWRLVDTPSQCRYVALSYVWGKAPVFRHLLENTQDLRKPDSLRSLPIPATIRDAITLVHAIGERYLWVDSICTIQDDLRMQQTEIMRMGSIYTNALFTVIAAAGDHANSGLPGVEPGSRERAQKILKLGDSELLTIIDFSRRPIGIDDTVWAQRAWTFQEHVLSSRLLVFSGKQVYWSCRVATYSEESVLEDVEDIGRLNLAFPEKPASHLPWKFLQPYDYRLLYDDLLTSYRERRLTYQTDILNAFSGVANTLSASQNDTFFWGLPESHFSYAILWETFGDCTRNYIEVPIFKSDGTKEMVPIPSWSWAAWGANDWVHLPKERNTVRPIIQFHLVDNERKLVRIKEQPWQDHTDKLIHASWQNVQPHMSQSPLLNSPSQIGQLHFWTSHANVRAIQTWIKGGRGTAYNLIPTSDPLPELDDNPDLIGIVYQEFIVIAARGNMLILFAIEWKDGVAYRIGKAEYRETEWAQLENKQWRLITLG